MPTWGRSASRRARKWRETRLWEPSARRWTSRRCRPNTASCSASIRPIRSRRCPRRTVSRSRGDLPRRQTAARRPRVCDCRTRNAGGASGGPVSGKGGKASLREGRKAGLPKRRKGGSGTIPGTVPRPYGRLAGPQPAAGKRPPFTCGTPCRGRRLRRSPSRSRNPGPIRNPHTANPGGEERVFPTPAEQGENA